MSNALKPKTKNQIAEDLGGGDLRAGLTRLAKLGAEFVAAGA